MKNRNLSGNLEIFDLMKSAASALSDSPISYEALPGINTGGCWKVNCDRSPFFIPFETQVVNYDIAGYKITARKEINLLPWILGGLAIYFIMK
jgi:hypothetical protein